MLDPCGVEQAQQEAGGMLAVMPTANEVSRASSDRCKCVADCSACQRAPL